MSFDREKAETIAPVLAMVGQQSRLDPNWTCQMLESVAGQVLPDFYRQARNSAETNADKVATDLKLALVSGAQTEDIIRLAQDYSDDEKLTDALFWISKAIDTDPKQGEYFRFKASILERMQRFEEAVPAARMAAHLGANAEAIRCDIERIETAWQLRLSKAARSANPEKSLPASLVLLERGQIPFLELPRIIFGILKLFRLGKQRSRANRHEVE